MGSSEEQILKNFKNCNPGMVAQAIKDEQSGCSCVDGFAERRNKQELDKFVEGALYILNKNKKR